MYVIPNADADTIVYALQPHILVCVIVPPSPPCHAVREQFKTLFANTTTDISWTGATVLSCLILSILSGASWLGFLCFHSLPLNSWHYTTSCFQGLCTKETPYKWQPFSCFQGLEYARRSAPYAPIIMSVHHIMVHRQNGNLCPVPILDSDIVQWNFFKLL